ncbi:hypothetical protein AMAG_13470 [Allomyces macrogynus ATCC 38327]|uniref:BZIP domain-containing protein n=1 Tax=Allomyces macrogynus (strain ATCC 38327) TaxID=578462 RepID=A0A0L0T284_ALLM3|nr:hypothetical protein AMAG_13470 [Allomyces macrogynus ATCC 38327]|eukprot:KNE68832.1 hypothetical protein AMAG_13470 [Allomyces macrogynus ATCC 38327]
MPVAMYGRPTPAAHHGGASAGPSSSSTSATPSHLPLPSHHGLDLLSRAADPLLGAVSRPGGSGSTSARFDLGPLSQPSLFPDLPPGFTAPDLPTPSRFLKEVGHAMPTPALFTPSVLALAEPNIFDVSFSSSSPAPPVTTTAAPAATTRAPSVPAVTVAAPAPPPPTTTSAPLAPTLTSDPLGSAPLAMLAAAAANQAHLAAATAAVAPSSSSAPSATASNPAIDPTPSAPTPAPAASKKSKKSKATAAGQPSPPTNRKRTASQVSAAAAATASDGEGDLDDGMDLGDDGSGAGGDAADGALPPPDKRKKFLERNRIAAMKCRQKRKEWMQNLEHVYAETSTRNEDLLAEAHRLRDEILHLRAQLVLHKACGPSCAVIPTYMAHPTHPPDLTIVPPPVVDPTAVVAAAATGNAPVVTPADAVTAALAHSQFHGTMHHHHHHLPQLPPPGTPIVHHHHHAHLQAPVPGAGQSVGNVGVESPSVPNDAGSLPRSG